MISKMYSKGEYDGCINNQEGKNQYPEKPQNVHFGIGNIGYSSWISIKKLKTILENITSIIFSGKHCLFKRGYGPSMNVPLNKTYFIF